ncbi:hypothetical protein GTP44_25165 [Duganella sp. FT50W]|uniref:Uncharacterized protein n=1 Tax=Duganella lactea TaxID=2692173 RepID=A0A6L8MT68_9BURK|nr:hypothetical protein [Duganella lactea]MYM85218.1 hypothetical protein [Duganella lactea]
MDAAHVDFIPPAVYAELLSHLHKKHSTLSPTEAVACALRLWMAQSSASRSPLRGYQWKELFLPDTTCLRMTYKDIRFFAKVIDDDIVFRGHPVTPRKMAIDIAGDGRNAWRDLWVLLPDARDWTNAARLRAQIRQRLDQRPLSPAEAMNTTLNAAMLLIRHVDHQSTTIAERRLPKHRRQSDLLDDDH